MDKIELTPSQMAERLERAKEKASQDAVEQYKAQLKMEEQQRDLEAREQALKEKEAAEKLESLKASFVEKGGNADKFETAAKLFSTTEDGSVNMDEALELFKAQEQAPALDTTGYKAQRVEQKEQTPQAKKINPFI